MIGKWYLFTKGKEIGLTGKPLVLYKHGFDMVLYTFNQMKQFNPYLNRNGKNEKFEEYCGDILFDEAMKWIEKGDQEQPYFVYLATSIPHAPVAEPEDYLALYEDSGLTEKQAGYYTMV